MQWVRAAEYPADTDLSLIDKRLHRENVPHRFTMEGQGQVLWLGDTSDIAEILSQVNHWVKNPESLGEDRSQSSSRSENAFRFSAKPAPVSLTLLALSLVGASLYGFGANYGSGMEFISPFTFWHPDSRTFMSDPVFMDIASGEYWRLITPIFVHFSPTHIIFNGLWLWYLGTMIERGSGPSRVLILVLFIGLVSNIAQALVSSDSPAFGGMSGVNFGLLSYLWLAQRLGAPPTYNLSNPIFFFMTGYMLLSTLGIFDWMAGGVIADTAHIVGYITGMICASAIYLFNKSAT